MEIPPILRFALLFLNVVSLVVVVVLFRQARQRAKETGDARAATGSAGTEARGRDGGQRSAYLRELEARERWEAMELERLHEINREEVERLLSRIRTYGVARLAPQERTFLDRMAAALESGARP